MEDSAEDLREVVFETVDDVLGAEAVDTVYKASAAKDHDTGGRSSGRGEAPQPKALTHADSTAAIEKYKEILQRSAQEASSAAMQLATIYHYGIEVERGDS